MVLHRFHSSNVTVIQNRFIDEYMISASGEFVKIYLYLLRCSSSDMDITLSSIADSMNCTEGDVKRALAYWEKFHLLHISYDENGDLSDLSLMEPDSAPSQSPAKEPEAKEAKEIKTVKEVLPKEDSSAKIPDASSTRIHISPERKKELAKMEDIQMIIHAAQQYLNPQLPSSSVDCLLYFYDELHFSCDVIIYLMEYCVSRGIRSMQYLKAVAFEWYKKGVKTEQDAKEASASYQKDYYTILKAYGIHNRGPAASEVTYMDNWIRQLGFSMDIILEAVKRTIIKIHNPEFRYTDSILQDWHKKGVHHLSDIEKLEKPSNTPTRPASRSTRTHSDTFGFETHDYDFQKLEEQLLDY